MIATELTITGVVPVAVKVSDCNVVVFTVTSPKLRLTALAISCELDAAVPVPFSITTIVLSVDALLLIVS
jgi:hypothetical protein